MTDITTVAKIVEDSLSKEEGYILLIFPFGVGVECQYAANVLAEDAIPALRAYADTLAMRLSLLQ